MYEITLETFYKILVSSKTIWAFTMCQILSLCMLIFIIWEVDLLICGIQTVYKKVAG